MGKCYSGNSTYTCATLPTCRPSIASSDFNGGDDGERSGGRVLATMYVSLGRSADILECQTTYGSVGDLLIDRDIPIASTEMHGFARVEERHGGYKTIRKRSTSACVSRVPRRQKAAATVSPTPARTPGRHSSITDIASFTGALSMKKLKQGHLAQRTRALQTGVVLATAPSPLSRVRSRVLTRTLLSALFVTGTVQATSYTGTVQQIQTGAPFGWVRGRLPPRRPLRRVRRLESRSAM